MLTRDEATAACRNVRNLWPRDESEALRYRRQVCTTSELVSYMMAGPYVVGNSYAPIASGLPRSEVTISGKYVEIYGDVMGLHSSEHISEDYALVEWLAPDGRCADHGDVERHGEKIALEVHGDSVRLASRHPEHFFAGEWAWADEPRSSIMAPPIREHARCTQADRFKGHEGDPWCGEYHLMPGLVRADYHEGDGMRLYKAPRGPDGSILAVPVPRERLTAEHPDHARHEAELFGPGEGNLIGGVVVYPSHPPATPFGASSPPP